MVVYIEQILIDNFIINLFIILSLKAILKAKFKRINMVLSSLLGSIISLITPLFKFGIVLSFVFKIVVSLTMVVILKKFYKIKDFILSYLTFIFLTFLFGGCCLFVLINFDSNFNINNYTTYSLPLGIVVLIIFFLLICIKNIFKNFYKRKTANNFIYKIKLFNNNEFDEVIGYLDSGNFLKDNESKRSITIVAYNALKNLMKEVSITDIILNKTDKINKIFKNVHLINISSVSQTNNRLLVFSIDKLEIYLENNVHIINNAYIGLTLKGFINELGYNALLGPNIFKEWLYECFKNFKKSCF